MELYFKELRSFTLMRKREANEVALQTFLDLLLNVEEQMYVRVPETLLYGYADSAVLAFTGSKGVKTVPNATPQHLSDFLTLCSHHQNPTYRTPLCIARQESTTVVMDTLSVASLWHKCTSTNKKLILQRFILSSGGHQIIAHAKWKAGKTTAVTFCNKLPHFDQNTLMKFYGNVPVEERFLTSAADSVIVSNCPNLSQISETMDVLAYHLRRKFKSSSFSEVQEFLVEFVQDVDLNWFALRLISYELDRKPKVISKALLQRNRGLRSLPISTQSSPKKLRIVRKEPYPFKNLSFPVSPFELKQAMKQFSRRKRLRSSFMTTNQLKKSLSYKSFNTSVTISKVQIDEIAEDSARRKKEQMPPIFSFPTPKTPQKTLSATFIEEDGLGLMQCPMKDRVGIIREHIIRQNNSLYTRIHYQRELPENRILKEVYAKSMDKVVKEMEHLRSKARLARESLNLLKRDRSFT